MFLTVHVPESCPAERRYIVSLVFEEFLGVQVKIAVERRSGVLIVGADGKELTLDDRFFATAEKYWLEAESMPIRPVRWVDVPSNLQSTAIVDPRLPVLFGEPSDGPIVKRTSPSRLCCTLDILGTVFFLVSRYEELVTGARDDHGRFPAEASIAHKAGFLDRPIADEYVELLWWLLSQQWPQLCRKEHRYQLHLSHDVDSPYQVFGRGPMRVAMGAAADLVRRKSLRQAGKRIANAIRVYGGNHDADPYNTFSFMMSTSERYGLQSAFYFITQRHSPIDGTYHFRSAGVRRLMKRIHERGHEIGLHPSYETLRHVDGVGEEFTSLREQCDQLGTNQSTWGGRQHYLRWQNPRTWKAWEQAGLDYDSTVGFADEIGFRCGTCREFSVYDLVSRRAMRLKERPLIAMECVLTVLHKRPWDHCYEQITKLANACRRVNGNFTLLWHNNNLATESQRRWYEEIVQAAA